MEVKNRDFTYNSNCISERNMTEHVTYYKMLVERYNLILKELKNFEKSKDENSLLNIYKNLKAEEVICLNGIMFHEFYFQSMTRAEISPKEKTMQTFKENFGSFENWVEDFIKSAKISNGYVMLVYEQRTKIFKNIVIPNEESGTLVMAYPIIVLDICEHAYYMDYGLKKENYIKRFIKTINWDIVERQVSKF